MGRAAYTVDAGLYWRPTIDRLDIPVSGETETETETEETK